MKKENYEADLAEFIEQRYTTLTGVLTVPWFLLALSMETSPAWALSFAFLNYVIVLPMYFHWVRGEDEKKLLADCEAEWISEDYYLEAVDSLVARMQDPEYLEDYARELPDNVVCLDKYRQSKKAS